MKYRTSNPATYRSTDDADNQGANPTSCGLVTENRLRNRPSNQTQNDPTKKSHDLPLSSMATDYKAQSRSPA